MSRMGHIEYDAAPSNASRQIVGPSNLRRSITFFPPGLGRVTLSNSPVLGDYQGLVLEAGQPSRRFSYDDQGDIVTLPWFALYSVGASGASWVQEMVCPYTGDN